MQKRFGIRSLMLFQAAACVLSGLAWYCWANWSDITHALVAVLYQLTFVI